MYTKVKNVDTHIDTHVDTHIDTQFHMHTHGSTHSGMYVHTSLLPIKNDRIIDILVVPLPRISE